MEEIRRGTQGTVTSEGRTIEGYALKFETCSAVLTDPKVGKFIETISRGAITQTFIDQQDVICYLDHNVNKMLARSRNGKGTLKLTVDEVGLYYSFEAPKTVYGDEALELIKRGDVSGSSFAAKVSTKDCTVVGKRVVGRENITVRRIDKFTQLLDVSPVQRPAYQNSSAIARNRLDGKPVPKGRNADGSTKMSRILQKELESRLAELNGFARVRRHK